MFVSKKAHTAAVAALQQTLQQQKATLDAIDRSTARIQFAPDGIKTAHQAADSIGAIRQGAQRVLDMVETLERNLRAGG